MTISLRPYQAEGIARVRDSMAAGNDRVVYVLPTGGGKSLCCAAVCKGIYQRNKRAVILAHRDELLTQLSTALTQTRIPHGMLMGGMPGLPRERVAVCSVGTLANRLRHFPAPDLIFIDECHHAVSGTRIAAILERFPRAKVMGLTATPQRLDGRGLGEMFQDMVLGPSVAELTAQGYLVPAEIYSTPKLPDLSGLKKRGGDFQTAQLEDLMDKPSVTGDAVEHYRKYANGLAAVVFCVSVKHSQDVAEDFCRAGYRFVSVDGRMDRLRRKKAIDDLRTGAIHGITSCEIIGEGVDVPRIEVVILLRPTESLTLAMQQIGRGLRPYPGKTRCIVLDHAAMVRRHGFPDEPRAWSLAGGAGTAGPVESVPRVRMCEKCYACYSPQPTCPRCGWANAPKDRKILELDGELELVSDGTAYEAQETADPLEDVKRQYYVLRSLARNRGYSDPEAWAFRIVSARLADRLGKSGAGGAVKDAAVDELERQTVMRDRVMTAMSREDGVLV